MARSDTSNSPLKARFEQEMRHLLNERIGVAFVVGALIYPLFIFQDYRMVPDRWRDMLVLRLISSLLCILGMAVNKTRFGERHPFAIVMFMAWALSVIKTFITPLEVQGIGALYFGGHVLIMVAGLAFLPFSLGQAVAAGLSVQLGFTLPLLLLARTIDPVAFSSQNSLMLTIWAMMAAACHLNHQMRFREFRLRMNLYKVRQQAKDYGGG